jgi:hypothetical protein
MSQASLKSILQQLKTLTVDELRRIDRAVRERLAPKGRGNGREAVYAALKANGLVAQIKQPKPGSKPPQLVKVDGKPVSQTIIEERR